MVEHLPGIPKTLSLTTSINTHTQLSSVTQKNEGPPISLKLGHHTGWIAGFKTDGFEAPIGQIA